MVKIILVICTVLTVLGAGAGLGFITASFQSLPQLGSELQQAASSQFYDSRGNLIGTTASAENRLPVRIDRVPANLQNAFIAAEDVRFYQHHGIDPRGILRAVWTNISNQGVAEGGSTITQQLAKNALLTQERTFKRKIQEAFLALQLERQYSKREILEMYLNQIYFGQGAYGVEAAALVYFDKHVDKLSLAECAMIAGIPKSPNYYSPHNNLKAAKERQEVVLDQMAKYNLITAKEAADAKAEKIVLSTSQKKNTGILDYFLDYVTQQLVDKYGADAVYKEGMKIYTTLDMDMQIAAEKAIQELPTYYTDSNKLKQPQGALVAIEPSSGHIKAMVGGRGNDQFNRAVLAERQPGSAFKPFVYLAALESGLTPATIIEDKAISFNGWEPQNYDRRYHGKVSLRTALAQSYNVPVILLTQQLTPEKVLYYAQQMGLTTLALNGSVNDRNLAMALGGLTRGVTPLEMASAYGVLANQGVHVEPIAVTKIVDRSGKTIYNSSPKQKAAVNPKSAYVLVDMMQDVLTRGTGTAAYFGRPAAGKTGTTSEYKDAWFVGFTPDISAAVWVGNDIASDLDGMTGGTTPAVIWRKFMSEAHKGIPVHDFIRPSGVYIPSEPAIKEEPKKEGAAPPGKTTPATPGKPPVPPKQPGAKPDDGKQDTKPTVPVPPTPPKT